MIHPIVPIGARIGAALAVLAVVVGCGAAAAEPQPASPPTASSALKEPVSADRLHRLIRQLGDKDYYVRQRAQDDLARLGFEAFDALSAATTDDDLEIASRAKYLLRLMRVEWTTESDPPEVKACLQRYESEDAPAREARMRTLAGLPQGEGVAALCRLARFEKSPLLSKAAAIALLSAQINAPPPAAAVIDTVRRSLRQCKRPGAAWLLAWTRLGGDPQAVVTEWTKLIDAEHNLLRTAPNESSPEIVAGLARFQIARLKKLGKTDEAAAAIGRLVELERGDAESLAALLEWLTEQKAWNAVDALAQRFAIQFAVEPGLLYALADAYLEQGQTDRAQQTAKQAFRLHPGKQQKALLPHFVVAQHLRGRGQFAWAQREFEHVIAEGAGADNDDLRAMTQSVLAEMFHDQGQEIDAAQTLQKLVQAIDAGKVTEAELGGRKASEIRSRMHYFFACHWQGKGDAAKGREYLDKALRADPTDVDVLIACYRLPGQTPEYHAKIIDLIKKAAAATRQEMAQDPESASPYNQFAWLIGNTEGDFDEALKCSLKSLELQPNEGGFYDTLGRVYFAKGDLQNAVKQQTRAAELEPHSGLIRGQLEFFRQKLEEKKKS